MTDFIDPFSIPNRYIKPALRFFYYPQQRRKVFREVGIKRQQNRKIKEKFTGSENALIVFLVPGADWNTGRDSISGGVLSIASLFNETEKLGNVHHSGVIMCSFPHEHLLLQHENFENDIIVFRFEQVLEHFTKLQKVVIHVPELYAKDLLNSLSSKQKKTLRALPELHINILNQNIRLMPGAEVILELEKFAGKVTITTAHAKYSTAEQRARYGVPVHFFSTFASPEDYGFKSFKDKENLLVLSPDDAEKNASVIELLKEEMPELQVVVIKGLTYQNYKELIGRAKWSITFGEGLDFYFIEPVFSGGVSFAIFNELFFTSDFRELQTVFSSYEDLLKKLVHTIRDLDNEGNYAAYQQKVFQSCAKYYSKEQYRNNIAAFYQGNYTFQ